MTTLNLDERQSTEEEDQEDVDTEAREEVVVPEVKSAKTKVITPGSVEKSKEPSESELFFDFDEFPLDSFNSTMTSQTDTTCTDADESDVSKTAGGSATDKLQLTSDDEAEEDDVISKELSTDVTAIDENLVLRLELSPSKSLPSGSRSDAALTPGRDVISDAEEEELPSLSRSEVRDTSDSSLIDFNSTAQTLGSTRADQEDDAGDEEKMVRGEVAEEENEMEQTDIYEQEYRKTRTTFQFSDNCDNNVYNSSDEEEEEEQNRLTSITNSDMGEPFEIVILPNDFETETDATKRIIKLCNDSN